jgi:hypothetical protein
MNSKQILTRILISFIVLIIIQSSVLTVCAKQSFGSPEKYAVIIVGCYGTRVPDQSIEEIEQDRRQCYGWYLQDAQKFYDVLKSRGYDNEHIIVLITTIEEYDYPAGFDDSIIDHPANKITIRSIFNGLKIKLGVRDSLLVILLNHGSDGRYFLGKYLDIPNTNGANAHNTFFALEPRFNYIFKDIIKYDFFYYRLFFSYCALWDYQLASYVRGIRAKMIFLLQPCNSGGFINDLSGTNRIICTASMENELADSWIGPFRWALAGTNGVDADLNDDEKISIDEAYRYAAEYATSHSGLGSQHPLIDDNGDKIGSYYNETSYDPNTLGMDGYLAAHTFL